MMNKSPFLGMDPYLEARSLWKGIHTQLIGELSTHQLPPLLAPAYFVDVEQSLQIQTGSTVVPDLQIEHTTIAEPLQPAGQTMPVAAPTAEVIALPESDEELDETALYIRSASSERLITIIEILSYSNKESGREKRARYLAKRREILENGIHLVEVDLLRGGQRIVDGLNDCPYHLVVTRADEQPQGKVWSFGIEDPIPDAPLPLIGADERVPMPLAAALASIFAARNFRQRIDYTVDPSEPLTSGQRAQIQAVLVREGLRSDAGQNGVSA